MQILPENILRWMDPEHLRLYAKGQLTAEQAIAKYCKREEKELHKQFELWCLRHEIEYCHSRVDKPTTVQKGISDFILWRERRLCFVEFKSEHGHLSKEQEIFIGRQQQQGTPVLVTNSFTEACAFVRAELALPL